MNSQNIINRVIPLPQNIKVNNGISFDKKRIGIKVEAGHSPVIDTAVTILNHFIEESHFKPDFQIELSIINEDKDSKVVKGLKNARFKQQAYAILPVTKKKVFSGILIKAYSDVGLLYGVRTLAQLLSMDNEMIVIPEVKVFDWPDVEFRGQWGGTSDKDIPYYSQFKYNAIDFKVVLSADEKGNAEVTHNDSLYLKAEKYGVDVAATISHLEQISRSGFLKSRPEIESIPSEERKNRCDYFPGLCMRHPVTKEMVTEWFLKMAENKHVHKILVWLSEEESPCFCERCKGEEPFSLEVECLLEAYQKMKKKYPDVRLGIMLSQGSFKVTEKLANMLPKEVSLTYYDGGRTYDSGQYEMVLPELLDYIQNGGLLGIYPQITHSWRTVFPMRSPYFIKYRCDEFVKKDIHRVIGYAVPDNRYHDFNLLCMLEWLWNNKGRDEKSFTMTYAMLNDYDPSLYYQYVKT
ncbi:MAG: hypothetical protein JXQ23_12510, partial [Clostridia bacterium]|nr:hypothetical protein [Clostridia bacterium]